MLALRFEEEGKPVELTEIPKPVPEPNEVLLEVHAASICGSDIHLLEGSMAPGNPPITLGHEGAGVVRETGDNVTHIERGDHVIANYILSCGNCRQCLQGNDNRCRNRESLGHSVDGTFAEYLTIPAREAIVIADHIPLEWGSITGCAVSTAFHAITERSGLEAGDTVAVFGLGGVGIHTVMWADFFGAGKILAIDVDETKLDGVEQYGADVVIDGSEQDPLEVIQEETDGWGVDIALECSGAEIAMEQAVESIQAKTRFESGNVVSVGIQNEPIEAKYYGFREGMITVSGDHTRYDLYQIARLLEGGKVDLSPSLTHRLSPREIDDALRLMREDEECVRRIVLTMNEM